MKSLTEISTWSYSSVCPVPKAGRGSSESQRASWTPPAVHGPSGIHLGSPGRDDTASPGCKPPPPFVQHTAQAIGEERGERPELAADTATNAKLSACGGGVCGSAYANSTAGEYVPHAIGTATSAAIRAAEGGGRVAAARGVGTRGVARTPRARSATCIAAAFTGHSFHGDRLFFTPRSSSPWNLVGFCK